MYELVRLSENDYFIDCPAKVGIVRTGGSDIVLVDSGSDKDAARKILRVIESKGWKLKSVFNTHSHADHIGGNRFLQEKSGCRIFANGIESVYSRNPVLEPVSLYGGFPFGELRNKFLLAEESEVEPLVSDRLPDGMKLLALPGHSMDMVGFVTNDGTAFVADAVLSRQTLLKYGICYLWDVGAALATLDFLKTVSARCFVPSHAEVTDDVVPLADINRQAIEIVMDKILAICCVPVSFDLILKQVFDSCSLQMTSQQFALVGSTVRSYLSYMCERGDVMYEFSGNVMLWKRCGGQKMD